MPSSKTRGVKFGNFRPEASIQKEMVEENLPRTNSEDISSHSNQWEESELDDLPTATDIADHDETLRAAEAELAELEHFKGFESKHEENIVEIASSTTTDSEKSSAEHRINHSNEPSHPPSRQEQDIARRKRLQLKLKTFHGAGSETVSYE